MAADSRNAKRGLLDSSGKKIKGLYIRQGILTVDIRFAHNPKWGDSQTTGERDSKVARDTWERNLANMKTLHKDGKFDEDAFQRFFPKRDVLQSNMLFSKLAAEWIKDVLPNLEKKKKPLTDATKDGYRTSLNCSWLLEFADTPISKITSDMVGNVLKPGGRLGKHADGTKSNYLSVLKLVFAYAIDKGYILASRNPTDKHSSAKSFDQLPKDRAWLHSDINELLNKLRAEAVGFFGGDKFAGDLFYNYYEWLFFSGERMSEAWAHEIRDIDFGQKKMEVSRSIVKRKLKATKTSKIRSFDMHPRAWACLQRQLKLLKQVVTDHKGDRQRIFVGGDRLPIEAEKTTSKIWNRVVDRMGFPKIKNAAGADKRLRKAYSTRHTSVTLQLMMGEHPRDVAREHGHSLQCMEQTYQHWTKTNDETRAAIRQLFGYDDLTERRDHKALLAEVISLRAQLAQRQPVAVAA